MNEAIVILAAIYLLILAFSYKVSPGSLTDGRLEEALELSGLLTLLFCGIAIAVVAFLRVVVFNNPV